MKYILALAVLILFAQAAHASDTDTVFYLKNGSAQVWRTEQIETKGDAYCLQRMPGAIDCIPKSDIKSMKVVESGTVDPLEVGNADSSSIGTQSDRIGADEYAKLSDKKRSENAAADRQREISRARDVKRYGEDKVRQRELSGQSAPVKMER